MFGTIGEPASHPTDGNVTVLHHQDGFPATSWPVSDSYFKALVYLQPGPNRLRFDFASARSSQQSIVHSSCININHLPLTSSPPLDLAIIVAKDSPQTFDTVPGRREKEGDGLETAIRKFRMAAYLWQAFTGEQMNRNGFGRRCFRYDESWQQSTLSIRDLESGQMRNEMTVHVIRSDKTVQEMRDLDLAQQYTPGKRKGELFRIAGDAVKDYFRPTPGQRRYVSCLLLDTHWDPEIGTIRGHAALGGGDSNLRLAIFGSHALQSYPTCIEEVVPAFTDCTPTDTTHVANDCSESGSNWEAVNIGIGAHMHETGHLFGCPHQESGVMRRGYVTLNRTFLTREPPSTRTGSAGKRLCLQQDECQWHRLDCLRFRYHPCFRLPTDPMLGSDDTVNVWPTETGVVLVTAATGVAFIELFTEGDDVCRAFIEYVETNINSSSSSSASSSTTQVAAAAAAAAATATAPTPLPPPPPRQVTLNENDLRARLPEDRRSKKLKIVIHSVGDRERPVPDFSQLASKASRLRLSNGQTAFRGSKLGFSQTKGSKPEDLVLHSYNSSQSISNGSSVNSNKSYKTGGNNGNSGKLLTSVRVYHGLCVDGLEFVYENGSTQLFGHRSGKPGGSEFVLDTRRGEVVVGFHVRAGLWIDGIQILTSLGRRSEFYGNMTGGSA